MTIETYFQWMRVWSWFATVERTASLEKLRELLNVLWQEERKKGTSDELAAYAGAWGLENLDFANDHDFQEFMREIEGTSGKQPD